jgi:hypothetical protein
MTGMVLGLLAALDFGRDLVGFPAAFEEVLGETSYSIKYRDPYSLSAVCVTLQKTSDLEILYTITRDTAVVEVREILVKK